MVAVGRRPSTDELGLDVAGVEILNDGLVKVDNQGTIQTLNQSLAR